MQSNLKLIKFFNDVIFRNDKRGNCFTLFPFLDLRLLQKNQFFSSHLCLKIRIIVFK